jgi:simple sugar transport system ATP-binding protein
MRGISKSFPGIKANDRVDLSLARGEILALVGENGAGKTTLMNILYGLYQPDEGEIRVEGRPVRITSPKVAIRLGLGMVHQHFMLVPPFTVTENIILGSEPCRGPVLDMAQAQGKVRELSERFAMKVDPLARIEDLPVGAQQRVEILKLLYRGAEILIFDEPTAVLTPQETEELFAVLKGLAAQGKSIIFITHKLKEVMALTDAVTVLRQGRVTGHVRTRDTTKEEIARMMVGREVVLRIDKPPARPGPVVLEVQGLEARDDRGLPALKGVGFAVRAGEILGLAGVAGNGQTELAEVLTGLRDAVAGRILLKGQDVTFAGASGKREAGMAHIMGIAHIPEDRHKRGLILPYSVALNLILGLHRRPPFARGWNLDFASIAANAAAKIAEFDIRTPSPDTPARALSGGNQQKIIIAREFSRDPDFLVVVQPTRGVDVGAIEFIHKRLVEMRDRGKAILLISLELEEILSLSDRIAVMYEGQIVGEMPASEADEHKLGLLMAGAHSGAS